MTTTDNAPALITDPSKNEKMTEVEMKETPENGAAEEKNTTTEEVPKAKTPSKLRQFFVKEKKEAKEKADTNGTENVECVKKECPFRMKKWCQKKADCEAGEMTIGMNMLDRDEKCINDHIKLQFEDVFGEPDGYHSLDCTWRVANRVFTGLRGFIYKLLAFIFALPFAILFAVFYALISAANIWFFVPAARAIAIPATWIAKVWNFLVRCILDPFFRSCGLCFSGVSVRHINQPDTVHIA